MINSNVKFKDCLFRFIFGNNKAYMLSLYNALNNSNYDNVDDIEITTIEDAIYITMKNDVSFIIDNHLVLYEQQSTYNPNMPIRGLMYYAKIVSKYIASKHLNIYGTKAITLPTPQYVVFYNGKSDRPEVEQFNLSSLFYNKEHSLNDWVAIVYNINRGNNKTLLDKCPELNGYMTLINNVNDNIDLGLSRDEAVDKAVDKCIEDNVLKDILIERKAEVKEMCLFEVDYDQYIESVKQDGIEIGIQQGITKGIQQGIEQGVTKGIQQGIEQGIEQGLEQGQLNTILSLYKQNIITLQQACKETNFTEEEFTKLTIRSD